MARRKADHYCKTPRGASSAHSWRCPTCGAVYRYVPEGKTWLGRVIKGYWLQIKSGDR